MSSSETGSPETGGADCRWIAKRALMAVLVWIVLLSKVEAATVENAERRLDLEISAGQRLSDALTQLQSRGLEIFFTSRLVRPRMRVSNETADALEISNGEISTDASSEANRRRILDQLLREHDLDVLEVGAGARQRLVVVAREPDTATLTGVTRVRDRGRIGSNGSDPARTGVGGVRILVDGGHGWQETISGADGSFAMPGLEPGSHRVEVRRPGFVVQRFSVDLDVGQRELKLELEPAPVPLEEVVITPSRVSLMRTEPVTALALDREEIFALPHFGEDIFRSFTLLPGVSGEEASARFSVRGGRDDEVLVLLDRVELFEPYHLKDFSSALSIISPKALHEVTLVTGGFSAQYGDRMGGVLDMRTESADRTRTHLGVSLIATEAGRSGSLARQGGSRIHWLANLRRGSLDQAASLLGIQERPRYWDGFAKLEAQPAGGRQRFGIHALHSGDSLDFHNLDPDVIEDYLTRYNNSNLWWVHQMILGPRLFADSTLSTSRVERDRRGVESDPSSGLPTARASLEGRGADLGPEGGFTLLDQRGFEVVGLKQDWNFQAAERHHLSGGFEMRHLVAEYEYFNRRQLEDPLAGYRVEPRTGTTELQSRLEGRQTSAYVSARSRLFGDAVSARSLTVEMGARYDAQTLTSDQSLSPRLNLVFAATPSSVVRFAWGRFTQSQRPYELQIEDGVHELASAERTEQQVLGFERSFSGRAPSMVRVEAYHRKTSNPRSRYENLYEPISVFPEIEPDRVLVRPEASVASGLEVFLRGAWGDVDWWTSYTLSRTEDLIEGHRRPRRIDQPHAVNFDLNLPVGQWNLNFAWRWHTGWPTTAIGGRLTIDEEGDAEVSPVLGVFNGERLPDYHRLDLRASREWRVGKGALGFYLEIQNLYDRKNVAGFDADFDFERRLDGGVELRAVEEVWGGLLPSFGITWEL